MFKKSSLAALLLLWVAAPVEAREVNITSDSAVGWIPSEADEHEARAFADGYLSAINHQQYDNAYMMLAPINKALLSHDAFVHDKSSFAAKAGAVKARTIVRMTWTNNPAHAPAPGIYAAIDVASRFTNIDRDCGYIVVYRAPGEHNFGVMREEANFIDNTTAAEIIRSRSTADLYQTWAMLTHNCPNQFAR